MVESFTVDSELLRRYDVAGPRYTSYPTAPQFSATFGERELRQAISVTNDDPIPRSLSVYVHVPFCRSACFYCGCNRVISQDRARGEAYLVRLYHEVELIASLIDRDREVVQLHFGGGTPNFLSPTQLGEAVDTLRRQFRLSRSVDAEMSIELDPRALSPGDVSELAAIGFNRASLGVQDFDPEVQQAVNRVQSVEQTLSIIEACRRHGMRSVGVDLIYGLPRQNEAGFAATLDTVIAARPDRVAVYGYAHLPQLFKAQRPIRADDLPSPAGKLALLMLAIRKLMASGYRYIGMDHFALPDNELALAQERGTLHRNFMGYTTHADTDLVSFGMSAISHVGATFSQNHRELDRWQGAVDEGRLPVFRGLHMSPDDILRSDLLQHLMCNAEIPVAALERRHEICFEDYFKDALRRLQPMIDDGLVRIKGDRIVASPQGRLLLRNIAMCFDHYLDAAESAPIKFSRAI